MSRRRKLRKQHEVPELNITAFLNLMVVLIPFLLLNAAFTQLTVLDLNLPKLGGSEESVEEERPELEVIVRAKTLVIYDRKKGPYLSLDAANDSFDYAALQSGLLELKSSYPDITQITLLSEPDIAYNQIIEVMDRVRQTRIKDSEPPRNVELFPIISIGDAPQIEEKKQP